MSMRNKKDSDFFCEVIKVLRSDRVDAKNRIDLRIVRWSRGGVPVFEKRRMWEKDGEELSKKMVGLNADDVKFLFENYSSIINLL